VRGVMSAGSFQLVEILMPRETGNGRPVGKGKGWFDGFLKELTERFNGANSFLRGTGPVAEQRLDREGQRRRGRSHRGRNDGTYGHSLRERPERELTKDEIVIRAPAIGADHMDELMIMKRSRRGQRSWPFPSWQPT
jgi:hypothetical protein